MKYALQILLYGKSLYFLTYKKQKQNIFVELNTNTSSIQIDLKS